MKKYITIAWNLDKFAKIVILLICWCVTSLFFDIGNQLWYGIHSVSSFVTDVILFLGGILLFISNIHVAAEDYEDSLMMAQKMREADEFLEKTNDPIAVVWREVEDLKKKDGFWSKDKN